MEELNFEALLEESLKTLHTGETVVGIVTEVTPNEVYLDLGTKVTGVIKADQAGEDANCDLKEMFKIGDSVRAFVIRVNDGEGMATLSKKRVDADSHWLKIVDLARDGEIVEGTVVSAIKGGVLMAIQGVNVFIPASHTDLPKGADLNVLVGTTHRVRVIEADEQRKRAVASIRVVAAEERKEKEAAFWATAEVGKKYVGIVKTLAAYGAFVDLGGVDGMVHNSELSWRRIRHPGQVVSVGQAIEVYIKAIDEETKRISLGYKTQDMDSWYQFTQKYSVGDVVTGKIVNIVPFGAFAQVYEGVDGGVDGLIHISRISLKRIAKPEDELNIGDEVEVKIIEIDNENRKLSLSRKALLEDTEAAAEDEQAEEAVAEEAPAAEVAAEEDETAKYIVGTAD